MVDLRGGVEEVVGFVCCHGEKMEDFLLSETKMYGLLLFEDFGQEDLCDWKYLG